MSICCINNIVNYLFKNEVIDYSFINNEKQDTILFLHGWGGNKFSFQSTINILKPRYNILTITMPTISPTTLVWNMFDYTNLVSNILNLFNIEMPIVICHSFGFRVAMLLKKKFAFNKIVVTGGAGIKKENIFQKINKNNSKIILKHHKFKFFYEKVASTDYLSLSQINKETFKNIVNLNLKFAIKFSCPMLLFWGNNDTPTRPWIAKEILKNNNANLVIVEGDHFAYIKENLKFNHNILEFLSK